MSPSDGCDIYEEEGICPPGKENTGRWTFDEHRLFLEGLEQYGKGWKMIATLIQTRTVVQIRTHAQKYFQKLQKAQASGVSSLDPSTLMSTMDEGKMRPAALGTSTRNLRSSSVPFGNENIGSRLSSLRNRRILRSSKRRDGSSSDIESIDGRSYEGSENEELEDQEEGEGHKEGHDEVVEEEDGEEEEQEDRGGAGEREEDDTESRLDKLLELDEEAEERGERVDISEGGRMLLPKPSGKSAISKEGGAAEARARAWDAAKAAFACAGIKRTRTEGRLGSNLSLSMEGVAKGPVAANAALDRGISPTSVADITFASFPAHSTAKPVGSLSDLSQMPQLAPVWCHKPQTTFESSRGADNAFRWFVDQSSMAAPGGFVLSMSESWSDSSDTEVSVTNDLDVVEFSDSGNMHREGMGNHCLVKNDLVDRDPMGSFHLTKRRRTMSLPVGEGTHAHPLGTGEHVTSEHVMAGKPPSSVHLPSEDASPGALTEEGGEGIVVPGLWLDDSQETLSTMLDLSLSFTSVVPPSMPSMDEDDVLGFLP